MGTTGKKAPEGSCRRLWRSRLEEAAGGGIPIMRLVLASFLPFPRDKTQLCCPWISHCGRESNPVTEGTWDFHGDGPCTLAPCPVGEMKVTLHDLLVAPGVSKTVRQTSHGDGAVLSPGPSSSTGPAPVHGETAPPVGTGLGCRSRVEGASSDRKYAREPTCGLTRMSR